MRQIRISRRQRPDRWWLEPLPPDARDPDIAGKGLPHSSSVDLPEPGRPGLAALLRQHDGRMAEKSNPGRRDRTAGELERKQPR